MSREENNRKISHLKEGDLCAMTGIVTEMQEDIGTLKDGQNKMQIELVKMGSEFKGFLDVYKIQREDMITMLHELKDSNVLHSKHIRELEKQNAESKQQNEIIKSQCLIKEKELILEIEKVRNESKIDNLKQDYNVQKEKVEETKDSFWMKFKEKVEDKIIELIIGACILGYMAFHGLPIK